MALLIDKVFSLAIGVQGENIARPIELDMTEWVNAYPGANFYVLFKPYNESEAVPMVSTFENNTLTWTPTLSATAISGVGYTEIRALDPDTGLIRKSRIIPTSVENSVTGADEDPPEPYEDWVNQVLTASNDAEVAKAAAQAARSGAEAARDAAQAAAGDFQGLTATATSLSPDQSAAVTVTHSGGGFYNLAFGIPKGAKGDPAPSEEVVPAVDAYLEEHITNPDSPPLDRTLSSSVSAAPADMVGELKNATDSLASYENIIAYNSGAHTGYAAEGSYPSLDRIGNRLYINGQYSSTSNTYCYRLSGGQNKGAEASAKNWTKTLVLESGHTYKLSVKQIDGEISNPSSSVIAVKLLDETPTTIVSVGVNASNEFVWASGKALLYFAAGKSVSCTNVCLQIVIEDITEKKSEEKRVDDLKNDKINIILDNLAANVFSKRGTDFQNGKGYSGSTGTIVDAVNNYITGYIPVAAGDCIKVFVNGKNIVKTNIDGQSRKIAFYNSEKTWEKTIILNDISADYYEIDTAGYARFMLRKADVMPEVYITSILKKDRLVDLVVFAGQSNMAGRGETSGSFPETAPVVIPGAGYEFKSITDPTKLYSITEPFGYAENAPDDASGINDGTRKTGDIVPAFVNAYYSNNGGVPVVGVSASEGGSSSSEWLPETGNNFLDLAGRVSTVQHWLADNGYSVRHQYCAWCQGESDGDNIANGTETLEEYKARALAIFTGLISLGMEKILLIRIGHHNSGSSTRYKAIIDWQTEECKTNENLVLVSCDFAAMRAKGMMKDSFHYYQIGYNITGKSAGINSAAFATTGKEPTMYDPENDNLYYSHKN